MGRQTSFLNPLIYLLCPLISEISQLLFGDVFILSSFLNDFCFVYIVLSGCYCFYLQCWEKFQVIFFWPWDLYQEVSSQAILCVSYFYCLESLATGCVKMFLHRQWPGKELFICFLVLRFIKQYFIEKFCTKILILPLNI